MENKLLDLTSTPEPTVLDIMPSDVNKFSILTGKSLVINLMPSILKNTTCITSVVQDGDWVGSDEPATNIEPPETNDGIKKYSIRSNTVTGDIIVRFGDSGDEKPDGIGAIRFTVNGITVMLSWNDTDLYFIGNDIDIANYMLSEVGNKVCFRDILVIDTDVYLVDDAGNLLEDDAGNLLVV